MLEELNYITSETDPVNPQESKKNWSKKIIPLEHRIHRHWK